MFESIFSFRRRSHTAPGIAARDAGVHGGKRNAVFGRPGGRPDDGVVRGRGQRIQRRHHVRGAQKSIAKTQRAVGKSVDKVTRRLLNLQYIVLHIN